MILFPGKLNSTCQFGIIHYEVLSKRILLLIIGNTSEKKEKKKKVKQATNYNLFQKKKKITHYRTYG